MPSERTSYEDATKSRLCRCYRVSRSYLHLNRGLTSPLATAMNFIPVSYFWYPLWWLRDAARCPPPSLPSLLSIISVARHLGAVFRTFAPSFYAKKRTNGVFDSSFPCANFAHRTSSPSSFFSGSPQTRISQTPPGPWNTWGDTRLDVRGSFREKMQSATAILPLYLGISRLSVVRPEISSRRTKHTATFPAFSIFVVAPLHSYE